MKFFDKEIKIEKIDNLFKKKDFINDNGIVVGIRSPPNGVIGGYRVYSLTDKEVVFNTVQRYLADKIERKEFFTSFEELTERVDAKSIDYETLSPREAADSDVEYLI